MYAMYAMYAIRVMEGCVVHGDDAEALLRCLVAMQP